jgi:aspartyl-tRNA(Asn)/glutamyl-tRNA(Gln) amidotransferase subunit A
MAGSDPLDPHTKEVAVPNYLAMLTGDIRGVRLGIPSNYFFDDVEPAIEKAVRTAIADLESLGAKTVPVSIPTWMGCWTACWRPQCRRQKWTKGA